MRSRPPTLQTTSYVMVAATWLSTGFCILLSAKEMESRFIIFNLRGQFNLPVGNVQGLTRRGGPRRRHHAPAVKRGRKLDGHSYR